MVNTRRSSYSPAPNPVAKKIKKNSAEKRISREEIFPKLQEVFSDLDLDIQNIAGVSPNGPADALANYVILNEQKFKKRNKMSNGEKVMPDSLEPTVITLINEDHRSKMNGNVLEMFKEEYYAFFASQNQIVTSVSSEPFDKDLCNRLLHQHFLFCRGQLIIHLVEEFSGKYSSAAAICFIVESGYQKLVRNLFSHIEDDAWNSMVLLLPESRRKSRKSVEMPLVGSIAESYRAWNNFISRCTLDYSEIFDEGNSLVKNAHEFERKTLEFQCDVCFDTFPRACAVSCYMDIADISDNKKVDTPSVSGESCQNSTHLFCFECIRGTAQAACFEMPLFKGGIGLKCMAENCCNPILFSECRSIIPPAIRQILNERITEESLGMADLKNLERCPKCNFAIEMEVSKENLKVFSCMKCKYEYCRTCERVWNEDHFGKKCSELDQEEAMNKETHKIEIKMSEAIIRKCDKCNFSFVKLDGCNKMSCRCGQTQCYLCRATNIQYDHFCEHFRDPTKGQCAKCQKKCLLWENAEIKNNQELNRIRQDAAQAGIELEKRK